MDLGASAKSELAREDMGGVDLIASRWVRLTLRIVQRHSKSKSGERFFGGISRHLRSMACSNLRRELRPAPSQSALDRSC